MTNYTGKPYVRIPEASRLTGMSKYCVRNLCKSGKIKYFKSGRVVYVFVSGLLDLVQAEKQSI